MPSLHAPPRIASRVTAGPDTARPVRESHSRRRPALLLRVACIPLALVALAGCQDRTPITGLAATRPAFDLTPGSPSVSSAPNTGSLTTNGSGWAIPSGYKQTCITGPNSTTAAATCPVLVWGAYTYWAYSDINNGNTLDIVAYDSQGNIAHAWVEPGGRYIWQITVDATAQTVAFWVQDPNAPTVTMAWADLQLPVPAVDLTAPTIAITTPANGAAYTLGQIVNANFACADEAGGSGIQSCVGTVANGAAVATASVGSQTFTVNAADHAGNTRTATATYNVDYAFSGFFAPVSNTAVNVIKAGSSVRVTFSLGGNKGTNIFAAGSPSSQPSSACTATAVQPAAGAGGAGGAGGGSGVAYDARTGQYTYTWKTDKAWVNSCRALTVQLNDNTAHTATFMFTK